MRIAHKAKVQAIMNRTWQDLVSQENGALVVIAALGITVLFGMAALALDIGHLLSVKNELQRAADAGALAGSRALSPYSGTLPNWSQGQTTATQTTQNNKVDGTLVSNCQVQAGYWSLTNKVLQSTGITSTSNDVPAIRVTAARASGQNGGPVGLLFGPVLGTSLASVSAHALAFISGVSGIPAGSGFPMATPKVVVDQYWYQEPPVSFKIGSSYHSPDGGQWSSFLADSNSTNTIRDLIQNGSPSPLKLGDNIWIQPGTKTALYSDAAALVGQTVIMPVVTTDFTTHAYTPILGFVAFYIEASVGGSGKYIQGHFVQNYPVVGTPGGPVTGAFVPPKLAYGD
jgi:Flp pilus assembly protein TadG